MLTNTLNTNEIKNSAGTEQEFQSLSIDQRSREFSLTTELPNRPHRLRISHQESGTGSKRVRRSLFEVSKTIISDVDNVTPVTIIARTTVVLPVGYLASTTEMSHVLANLISGLASDGSNTTIKYDGTGTFASALLSGGL